MTPAHSKMLSMMGDLIEYSHKHDLTAIAEILEAAREAIRLAIKAEEDDTDSDGRVERHFREVLDEVISHCNEAGLHEVVDHLMEAQMAWDEIGDTTPTHNVITFPMDRIRRNRTDKIAANEDDGG